MNFGWKKYKNLIDKGTEQRRKWCGPGEKLDVLSIIEFELPLQVFGFKWDIVADSEWDGTPDEEAFVRFVKAGRKIYPTLTVRETVWVGASKSDVSARFTLAHELAHIFLHQRLANVRLSREAHTPTSSRTNSKQEREANVYAGALLIDIPSITKETTFFDLRSQYDVSHDVARHALEQVEYVRKGRGF